MPMHNSLLLIPTHPHPTRVVIMATRLPLNNSLDLGLKTRSTGFRVPRLRPVFAKHDLDFLERLATGFRVGEEGLHSGGEAEYAEDDECFVGDVSEGRGDKEAWVGISTRSSMIYR